MTPADIRALRQTLGLSARGFARALGVTADYVAKLERGQRVPSASLLVLFRLARIPAAASRLREWGKPFPRGRTRRSS